MFCNIHNSPPIHLEEGIAINVTASAKRLAKIDSIIQERNPSLLPKRDTTTKAYLSKWLRPVAMIYVPRTRKAEAGAGP